MFCPYYLKFSGIIQKTICSADVSSALLKQARCLHYKKTIIMKKKDFVHLHLHSHFSLNNGIENIDRIVNKSCEYGMQAIALTDHNSLAGIVEFTKKCIEKEIKPISGCEINLASERKTKHNTNIFHITLLVENEFGYKNLVKLITLAHQRKRVRLPYITYEELKEHKRGLIAFTGCEKGELITAIIENRTQDTEAAFKDLLHIFSKENLFIELQNYQIFNLIDINKILIELANFLELPIVATQDVHYLDKNDRIFYEFVKSNNPENKINLNRTIDALGNRDKSFFSIDDIHRVFSYLPDAVENSLEIAQRCNFQLNIKKNRFFKQDFGRGFDPDSYLLDFISRRLTKKYQELDKGIKEKLNSELHIIKDEEISNGFIILITIYKFIMDNNVEAYIVSGWLTYSLVAFLIGLTNINPEIYNVKLDSSEIKKKRTLEIEIEIASEFLKPLVNYLFKFYSPSFICLEGQYSYWDKKDLLKSFFTWIINNNKMNSILEILNQVSENLSDSSREEQIEKYIEKVIDLHIPLPIALNPTEANIIFSGELLSELIPVNLTDSNILVSQLASESINELGIIRFELRKNTSLDIVNDAINSIKQDEEGFNLKGIPLSNEETFNLLSNGNTNGVPFLHNIKIKTELKNKRPRDYNQLLNIFIPLFDGKLSNTEIIRSTQISYYLSYIKAHYPAEFYASALTHYSNNLNCYNILINEAKNSGIKFLPIDINFSDFKFTIQGNAIRTGLCLINNFDLKAYYEISNIRKGGLFDSLFDLMVKTDPQIMTAETLKNLIMVGAFDSLNSDRYALLTQLNDNSLLPNVVRDLSRNFGGRDVTPHNRGNVEQTEALYNSFLDLEFEAIGTTLSQSLFDYYLPFGRMIGAIKPEEFQNVTHRQQTSVFGIFDHFEENRNIKKDDFICLDLQGIEVRVNEEIFLKDKEQLNSKLPVLVVGRKIIGEKGEYLFAKRIYDIRELVELAEAPHILELELSEIGVKKTKQLLKILNQYRGKHKIIIKANMEFNKRIQKKIEKQVVLCCPNLINELSNLLGDKSVKIRLDFTNN